MAERKRFHVLLSRRTNFTIIWTSVIFNQIKNTTKQDPQNQFPVKYWEEFTSNILGYLSS